MTLEYVEQAKLLSETVEQQLGYYAIAVSDDGRTVLVGAAPSNTYPDFVGGAVVFFRDDDGVWAEQANLATLSSLEGIAGFGFSVDLSADGNTAIVGAPFNGAETYFDIGHDSPPHGTLPNVLHYGAAFVFVRDEGGDWSQQEVLLGDDGGDLTNYFGYAVSLSADGDTAAVGDPYADVVTFYEPDAPVDEPYFGLDRVGGVYLFTRAAGAWSLQQKLVGETNDLFAAALELSGGTAGDLLLLSAPTYGGTTTGAIITYTRSGGGWTLREVTERDGTRALGVTISAARDGSRFVTSSTVFPSSSLPLDETVFVYKEASGAWELETTISPDRLDDYSLGDQNGWFPAISGDGAVIAIGPMTLSEFALLSDPDIGGVYVYARVADAWVQQQMVFPPDTEGTYPSVGSGVCLSANSRTLAFGGFTDGDDIGSQFSTAHGAAWVYAIRTLSISFDDLSVQAK